MDDVVLGGFVSELPGGTQGSFGLQGIYRKSRYFLCRFQLRQKQAGTVDKPSPEKSCWQKETKREKGRGFTSGAEPEVQAIPE